MARKSAVKQPPPPPNLLEMGRDERIEVLKKRTLSELAATEKAILGKLAQGEDTPGGFAAFYELIHGNKLPEHAKRWIEHIYGAHDEGVGALLWAWRGSWKSTTISVTFLAFRIGHNPERTNLVISANDDSADKVTAQIASIIEHSAEWKLAFGHIVPDKDRGYGAEGYFVKDTRMQYDEWAKKTSHRIDPSLLGAGINSSRLIGKHPSGVLLLDDIHDEKNSISDKERASVVRIVSDTILPMAIKDNERLQTWEVVVGTPWAEDDAYHYLRSTGQLNFLSMPVMDKAEEGEDGAVYIDGRNRDGIVFVDIVGWWRLRWPEKFGPGAIVRERATSALRGFARMYLLDLAAAKKAGLKYYMFPHEQIDTAKWPMYGGADLAFVMRSSGRHDPGRDFFSHSYGAKTPMGKLVVVDGVIEQCTQAQAEDHLKKPQDIFPMWRFSVLEGDGIGETFYTSLVMRNPQLRVSMMKTKGKGKRWRQEQEMGPWLENGQVMISDADTPYLNALRKALDDFPDGNNDIRDGLYWLCRATPDVLVVKQDEDHLPLMMQKQRRKNPIYSLAKVERNA